MYKDDSISTNIPEFTRFVRNLFASLVIMVVIATTIGSFSTFIGSFLP